MINRFSALMASSALAIFAFICHPPAQFPEVDNSVIDNPVIVVTASYPGDSVQVLDAVAQPDRASDQRNGRDDSNGIHLSQRR